MASGLVLLPPFVVLITAFLTRKLNSALIIGILSAALVATHFTLQKSIQLAATRLIHQIIDPDYLYLYAFLLLIGMLIFLISKTGGATGFAQAITRHIRSKKAVETSSILLSSALFIDDYLSNLTVGYVLRPLTDAFNIPRVKLAYLVHSLSGPLVILVPVTSWVAMITSQLNLAGIGIDDPHTRIIADPFFVYLNSIPYIFYSILVIASVLFIVRKRVSYGPMAEQEHCARITGNLFGGKQSIKDSVDHGALQGSASDLLFPLGLLLGCVFLSILYVGGFSWLGGTQTLIQALQNNTNTFFALFISACITLVSSFLFGYMRGKISLTDGWQVAQSGFSLMKGAVFMVLLASTLGVMFKKDLAVGSYLASIVAHSLPLSLLPVSIFIVSTIIATITGSSWGTIAIMTPVVIQMMGTLLGITSPVTPNEMIMLFPMLGAVFSGAVCGDHISPISETTIMASTSAGCYPVDHTITQFYYTLPAIVTTCIAFVLAGYIAPFGNRTVLLCSIGISMPLCLMMIWILNRRNS